MPQKNDHFRTLAQSDSILYRFGGQLDPNTVGLVPEGLLMANGFEGRVTDGIMQGARVWGVDHLLVRADGVGVIDAPKTLSLQGRHLFEHLRGYCIPPEGLTMPPLDALLAADFAWPDVPFIVHGTSIFRTADPELCALGTATARVDGRAWLSTGRLEIEVRTLTPRLAHPFP